MDGFVADRWLFVCLVWLANDGVFWYRNDGVFWYRNAFYALASRVPALSAHRIAKPPDAKLV